jgi:hypothetical protein
MMQSHVVTLIRAEDSFADLRLGRGGSNFPQSMLYWLGVHLRLGGGG